MRDLRLPMVFAGALFAAGCSGGGGGSFGGGTIVDPPPETPITTVALDLSTGASQMRGTVSAHGGAQAQFQRVDGSGLITDGDALGAGGRASPGTATASPGRRWIARTELSRGQWKALVDGAGSGVAAHRTPWAGLSAELAGAADDAVAACALSFDAVDAVLAAWNAAHAPTRLRLPTHAEWEVACRAGSTADFAWGTSSQPADVLTHALVAGLPRSGSGPEAVAQRQANAYGLIGMHGNVWEWAGDGSAAGTQLRGGSWHDDVGRAIAGNRLAIPADVPYATAGLRLVLELP